MSFYHRDDKDVNQRTIEMRRVMTSIPDFLKDHWTHLPDVIEHDTEVMTGVDDSEVRQLILKIMQQGHEYDENFKQHAFTAKELMQLVNNQLSEKVKLPNIYFHLEKLVKWNLIEVIGTTSNGRYTSKYYGRLAKLYVFVGETRHDKMNDLLLIAQRLNPAIKKEDLNKQLEALLVRFDGLHNQVRSWFKDHAGELQGIEIDIPKFYEFIAMLHVSSHETVAQGLTELFKVS